MSQGFWAGAYRSWFWIGPPVMAGAATALALLIPGLVGLVKRSQLFRAPLAGSQEVEFAEAGPVSLGIEGPRGTGRFAPLTFELRAPGGAPVEGRTVWFRMRSSGTSTATTEILTFDIPRPGRYSLDMKGLGGPREGDDRHAVVFSRSRPGATIAFIAGIVLAAGVFIASLVFLVLRLRSPALPS